MPEITLLPVRVPERLPSLLTSNERRDLEQAERKIAAGLRSFLEVGSALKAIRDRRLFRQHFKSFEEYCAKRWDFSRQRGYELLGASDVVADLSAVADIRVLPVNEAQARPLTVLRAAAHRRRAWKLALRIADKAGRAVTARDTEEAVRRLNGKIQPVPVDGVPEFDGSKGMRAVYCDPPYPNMARRLYDCPEVDHSELIQRLETFDAWALSTNTPSLRHILPLCPEGVRLGAWTKPWSAFRPNVNPSYSWEVVIFRLSDRRRTRHQSTIRDWVSANATRQKGLIGAKPEAFCFWIFEMLNLRAGDEFYDLYEGTCAVTRAFRRWLAAKSSTNLPRKNRPLARPA